MTLREYVEKIAAELSKEPRNSEQILEKASVTISNLNPKQKEYFWESLQDIITDEKFSYSFVGLESQDDSKFYDLMASAKAIIAAKLQQGS